MDGLVVIDKPSGMTSHDVVDAVRRRLGERRVGHAGTLDPEATGVLVVGVGRATRLLDLARAEPKSYRAGARFGVTTSTQDAWGEVVARRPAALTRADVAAALGRFEGRIQQVPPMVSAVKVGGERLYRKARRGEEVERAARDVVVHRLELVDFRPGQEPEADLVVECSAGTYVRTLIHDLGEALGCGAHMTSLRRTAVGPLGERDAIALEALDEARLRPLIDAVRSLPRVAVDPSGARLVADGRPLALDRVGGGDRLTPDDGLVAVIHEDRLVGLYRVAGDALVAHKVLV